MRKKIFLKTLGVIALIALAGGAVYVGMNFDKVKGHFNKENPQNLNYDILLASNALSYYYGNEKNIAIPPSVKEDGTRELTYASANSFEETSTKMNGLHRELEKLPLKLTESNDVVHDFENISAFNAGFYDFSQTTVSFPLTISFVCPKYVQGNDIKITKINGGTFNKKEFETVEISEGVEVLEDSVFIDCKINKLVFANSLKTIKSIISTSADFTVGLKEIDFKELTILPPSLLKYVNGLEEFSLTPHMTDISWSAFAGCTTLKKVNGLEQLTAIPSNAFNWCTALEEFKVSSSIKEIGSGAFSYCSSLRKIFIPLSVEKIDYRNNLDVGLFANSNTNLKIYCEATEKPTGWISEFMKIDNTANAEVIWGVTIEQYRTDNG